jgi:SAM-dependent methyltransferase
VHDAADTDERFLEAVYWLVLGRPVDDEWRKTRTRQFELGQPRDAVLRAALGSSEFRQRHQRFHHRVDPDVVVPGEDGLERGLAAIGSTERFVRLCYELILGREADAGGLAYYVSLIDAHGQPRRKVLHTILQSQEFADRYRALCPAAPEIPVDVQLCELANPAKWDNPDWIRVLRALQLPAEEKLSMHRKAYEFTQTAWGLDRLGALTDTARVLSVGAGHESLVYWLANRVGLVVATDLYPGDWSASAGSEGDARVITHPEEFAPFPYRREHLKFLQMDGRRLAFSDNSFDVAYSLSSIEHFGGWTGARAAVDDMARVVRPGGLVVLATEWRVAGPPSSVEEIFEPNDFRRLIDLPTLEIVQPLDADVWRRYRTTPVNLRLNRYETPHMLVEIDGTVFTSVIAFLRRK